MPAPRETAGRESGILGGRGNFAPLTPQVFCPLSATFPSVRASCPRMRRKGGRLKDGASAFSKQAANR